MNAYMKNVILGGFGTNWKMAKSVAIPSILMFSFGVILTASLTGLFCYFVVKTSLLEGFLFAKCMVYILRYSNFEVDGFYTIFVTAVVMLSYSLSELLGGNAIMLSVSIQRTLIPKAARLLELLVNDEEYSVLRTFNDYEVYFMS